MSDKPVDPVLMAPVQPVPVVPPPSAPPPPQSETRSLNDFRIVVGTPHSYDTIFKQWFMAYEQLIKPANTRLIMDPNLPLDVNRNNAVEEALKCEAEYILFLDHDNVPDSEMLIRLLQANVPVIGALYFERKYPHLPLIYTFEHDFQTVRVEYNYPKAPVVRCDVIGLGCSLFKMEVFKQLERPWFCYTYKEHTWGTEDIGFFHKLKDANIPVYIDTAHTCGHLSSAVIDEGDWEYNKKGYLTLVNQRAKELGTTSVFLDKRDGKLIKSPSARD